MKELHASIVDDVALLVGGREDASVEEFGLVSGDLHVSQVSKDLLDELVHCVFLSCPSWVTKDVLALDTSLLADPYFEEMLVEGFASFGGFIPFVSFDLLNPHVSGQVQHCHLFPKV